MLQQLGLKVETMDGDVVRKELSPDLGFTRKDRDIHAKRVVYLCKLLCRNEVSTIVSLISPYRELRNFARSDICGTGSFIEIYVKCSLETCIKRDVKGLYRKALNGEIKDLTGLQDPYEEPLNPELTVNTEKQSVADISYQVIGKLRDLGHLKDTILIKNSLNV
jgi:adenylylsulfate kinase